MSGDAAHAFQCNIKNNYYAAIFRLIRTKCNSKTGKIIKPVLQLLYSRKLRRIFLQLDDKYKTAIASNPSHQERTISPRRK